MMQSDAKETLLPTNWELCSIDDITLPVEKIDPRDDPERSITYVDISGIDNIGNRIQQTKTFRLSQAPSRARQVIKKGDVLFSTVRPYLRNIAAVPDHLDGQIASTGFSVLRPATGISPGFLFYKAISAEFVKALSGRQYGVSYPAVKDEHVRAESIALPPEDEQLRIVAKIDTLFSELDAGAENLETARQQLRAYRQATLQHAFSGKLTARWRADNRQKLQSPEELQGIIRQQRQDYERGDAKSPRFANDKPLIPDEWIWVSVDEICAESLLGLVRSAKEQNLDGIGVSYIKMDRIDMLGGVLLSPEVFVEVSDEDLTRYRLKKGDILFNTRNSVELVGKSAAIRIEPPVPTIFNNNMMRIRTIAAAIPEFVGYQLSGRDFRNEMEKIKRATTSVAAVYGKDLWPLPVALPCMDEQFEIVRVLDEQLSVIDALLAEVERHLAKANVLRHSILDKALSGRLVEQDSREEPASLLLERIKAEKQTNNKKTKRKQAA